MIEEHRFPRPRLAAIPLVLIAVTTVIATFALPPAVARAQSICNAPYNPPIYPSANATTVTNPADLPLAGPF